MATSVPVDRDRATGRQPDPGVVGLPPPPTPPPVVLRRTADNVIAGVCGGYARYLGLDPIVVRLAFVLLTIFGGSGVLLYLISWIVIPEESATDTVGPADGHASTTATRGLLGVLLIVVGVVTLLSRGIPEIGDYLGPVLLIGAGILVVAIGGRR